MKVDQKSWAVKARPGRHRSSPRTLQRRGRRRRDQRDRVGPKCAARVVSGGLLSGGEREALMVVECSARRCTPLERRPPTATGMRERERLDKACVVYTPSSGPGSDSHFWAYMRAGRPPSMLGPWARDTVVGVGRDYSPQHGGTGDSPCVPRKDQAEGLYMAFSPSRPDRSTADILMLRRAPLPMLSRHGFLLSLGLSKAWGPHRARYRHTA